MYPPCCPLHKNPHTLLARSPLVVSSAISEWWTPTLLKFCCCFRAVFFWWIQFCWSSVTNPIAKTRPQTLGSFPRKAERRNLKPPVTRRSVPGWQLHLDGVFFMGNGIQPTKWWFNGDLMGIWLKYTPMMARCNPRIIYGYVQVSEENVCWFFFFFSGADTNSKLRKD